MNDQIRINLSMADGSYPVYIDPKDEEMVRKAAKQVDTLLNKFRTKFVNQSREQQIVMVALQFAVECLTQKQRNDTEPLMSKILEMSEVLEEYFKQL